MGKMNRRRGLAEALICAGVLLIAGGAFSSSHMDAPLITFDDPANTTDVYAFVTGDALTVALGVYPFEEPGVGPNKYNFDPAVLYTLHVATGNDLSAGRASISYEFRFDTTYKTEQTILFSYLGVVENVDDANQNLTQTYKVWKVDHDAGTRTMLGEGVVPPNNQGIATPFYNMGDDGNNPAKSGAMSSGDLDRYTMQTVIDLNRGHRAFAGQREDGFYGDINAIFDLLQLRDPGVDSQAGFNIHLLSLQIPFEEIGGDQQVVGVYATTSRRRARVIRRSRDRNVGPWTQVGRQGNPLFNEGFVAIEDKDRYSRTKPNKDQSLFSQYALNPELVTLIDLLVFNDALPDDRRTNRTDIAGIFIPDLIKVDLSTGSARLAGPPDDPGFSRLSIFGGDVLTSSVQPAFLPGLPPGTIPGGWPNGRRFGDDVVDIGISALISDLREDPPEIMVAGDNVDENDMAYNKVFPYAATPKNGRNHVHH